MYPRYTIEKDLEILHNEDKLVLMYTVVPGAGWVILWRDDQGYTVSTVTGNSRSNGGALPVSEARVEFRAMVESLF